MPPRKSKTAPDLLPSDVPVEMPNLPNALVVNTPQQLKAAGDPLRTRILFIIQHQPMTAKQVADRLGASPGAIGHHLKVLEDAGLAQVVARRVTRGIIAKYYTRTARIFNFDTPTELGGKDKARFDIFGDAQDEWRLVLAEMDNKENGEGDDDQYGPMYTAFPHARLSDKRAEAYALRLRRLVEDLVAEPPDPNGTVFGLGVAFFASPSYMQPEKKAVTKNKKRAKKG